MQKTVQRLKAFWKALAPIPVMHFIGTKSQYRETIKQHPDTLIVPVIIREELTPMYLKHLCITNDTTTAEHIFKAITEQGVHWDFVGKGQRYSNAISIVPLEPFENASVDYLTTNRLLITLEGGEQKVIRLCGQARIADLLDLHEHHDLKRFPKGSEITCNGISFKWMEYKGSSAGYHIHGFGLNAFANRIVVDDGDEAVYRINLYHGTKLIDSPFSEVDFPLDELEAWLERR